MLKFPGMAVALGLLLAGGAGMAAKAQATKPVSHEMRRQYEVIRNGIGILRYCENNGHLTADMANEAITIFESVLGSLSLGLTPHQTAAGDAAEKNGVEGKVGAELADFAEQAKLMETTPAELCQDTHGKVVAAAVAPSQEAYEQVRNQIGVMHYCREKGHIPSPGRKRLSASSSA